MAWDDPYMSDAQVGDRTWKSVPYWNDFSTDAFFALDPAVRGVVADAYYEAEGDPISTYAILGDQEYKTALIDRLMGDYGGNRVRANVPFLPEEDIRGRRDQMKSYGLDVLDNFLAAASPSAQRNTGLIDYYAQRYGGVPYPGGQMPGYEGPGFTGGGGGGGGGRAAGQLTSALAAFNSKRR